MSVSKSRQIANKKYRTANYDTIGFDVRKGKREEYKAAAAELGLSLAALLTNAAEEFIQRHGGEVNLPEQPAPITTQPQPKILAQDKQLLDAASSLSTEQKKALLKFLQSLNVAAENKAENTAKNASVDNHEPI